MKTVTQEEFSANAARLLSEARESGITIGLVGKDGELRMTIHPSARVVDSDCPNCDAWKARANKFEATVEMLEARGEADLLNAEAAIARATQAEAQAAAMREVLVLVRSTREAPGLFALGSISGMSSYEEGLPAREAASAIHGKVNVALDRHAGRTLLAELEALRALEAEVRDSLHYLSDRSCPGCQSAMAKDNLETELRAVDAARKGE